MPFKFLRECGPRQPFARAIVKPFPSHSRTALSEGPRQIGPKDKGYLMTLLQPGLFVCFLGGFAKTALGFPAAQTPERNQ